MTDIPVKTRKKLIEVALPLEAINEASGREKSIRHGHPSTLHLWWARRPLAAARAVIFGQMVDDPSEYVDVLREDAKLRRKAEAVLKARTAKWLEAVALAERLEGTGVEAPNPGPEPTLDDVLAEQERERLFRIIERLVKWESTTDQAVLQMARDEIWASWRRASLDNVDHPSAKELFDRHELPQFHDPFAGGGALPLEAQRLGLAAFASDLNPVSVLINKAMIEYPPRFAGRPPVNAQARAETGHSGQWAGAAGLANDIRFYGKWMRDEAERRIGNLYPLVEVTPELVGTRPDLRRYLGRSLEPIAWIWARTVHSPNPAFSHIEVPLASTFLLSTKAGVATYVSPEIHADGYRLDVLHGELRDPVRVARGTKLARANFECIMSGSPISGDYIKREGQAGRLGARLVAIAAEGDRERIYVAPTTSHEVAAASAAPYWKPEVTISGSTQYLGVKPYGMDRFDQLFTDRQLVALATFSDLVSEARSMAAGDALASASLGAWQGNAADAEAYADAISVYLAFACDYAANYWSSLATPADGFIRGTYSMQALQMSWDFAEAPPFGTTSGNWMAAIEWIAKAVVGLPARGLGRAAAADAARQSITSGKVVSTDPPYYDNVPYADLSDYFYVWLRRSLRKVEPDLFETVAVPKGEELVAFAYRHRDKSAAEAFFLGGMTQAMRRLAEQAHPAFPVTIYYAFKQAESDESGGVASTGWDTFLEAVIRAGFTITGTWPMRTERGSRNRSIGSNALASSIILVCGRRSSTARPTTRREFMSSLKEVLPRALANLQRGNIAPVDLAQAAIGPGMAVFTASSAVLDANGAPLSVRDALALINRTLDEALAEQEGEFDADSRWAVAWYEQSGFAEGEFGVADVLARAKNTSVAGMVEAGILESRAGKVRLLKPLELDPNCDPATDSRRPAWQSVHQLVNAADRGEAALAGLILKLGPEAETARELAYRLYVLSERKRRTTEAGWYNGLVQSWGEATRLAAEKRTADLPVQGELFGEG